MFIPFSLRFDKNIQLLSSTIPISVAAAALAGVYNIRPDTYDPYRQKPTPKKNKNENGNTTEFSKSQPVRTVRADDNNSNHFKMKNNGNKSSSSYLYDNFDNLKSWKEMTKITEVSCENSANNSEKNNLIFGSRKGSGYGNTGNNGKNGNNNSNNSSNIYGINSGKNGICENNESRNNENNGNENNENNEYDTNEFENEINEVEESSVASSNLSEYSVYCTDKMEIVTVNDLKRLESLEIMPPRLVLATAAIIILIDGGEEVSM